MNYLTLDQLKNELNISVITLRRYIKSGKLKAIKIGHQYRISEDELNRFLSTTQSKEKPINKDAIVIKKADLLNIPDNEDQVKKLDHNHFIVPNLNSYALEAVLEVAGKFKDISEIEDLIKNLDKDSLDLLQQVKQSGIKEPEKLIQLLVLEEASQNLEIRKQLFKYALERLILVILPLPPYLTDIIIGNLGQNLVISSEETLPPHLSKYEIPLLDDLNPFQVKESYTNIEYLILDGYEDEQELFVRQNTAVLIQLLSSNLKLVYVHQLPHPPRNTKLVKLTTEGTSMKVRRI